MDEDGNTYGVARHPFRLGRPGAYGVFIATRSGRLRPYAIAGVGARASQAAAEADLERQAARAGWRDVSPMSEAA